MISYIVESCLFQLLFIGFYQLFLRNNTLFGWNRAYLILTLILSLSLPWVELDGLQAAPASLPILEKVPDAFIYLDGVELIAGTRDNGFPGWPLVIWMGGAITSLCWLGFRIHQLFKIRRSGKVSKAQDFVLIRLPGETAAFSFFRWVFLGDIIRGEDFTTLLAHERTHVRHWHSLDLVFLALLRIPFWFNPLLWVYRKKIAEVHEYQADAFAVKSGKDIYYRQLLAQAFGLTNAGLVHPFYKKSLLKRRIEMLQKRTNTRVNRIAYPLVLPLIGIMLWVSSCEQEVVQPIEAAEQVALEDPATALRAILSQDSTLTAEERELIFEKIQQLIAETKSGQIITDESVNVATKGSNVLDQTKVTGGPGVPFAVVDQVPVFPGCEDATDLRACFNEKIQEHIRKHFNYPKEAQDQGIQGRVNVMFTIGEDGGIGRIKKRGPHPLLEQEVERIISRLPRMQPGLHQGKAVNVPFAIPVLFKLK